MSRREVHERDWEPEVTVQYLKTHAHQGNGYKKYMDDGGGRSQLIWRRVKQLFIIAHSN